MIFNFISENVNFKPVDEVTLILQVVIFQRCRNTPVSIQNATPLTSIALYVSTFVHAVLNGVKLELV